MERTKVPNLLLVSGSGRKSGKTTFICSLIATCSKKYPIVAVKVTKHMHAQQSGALLSNNSHYNVFLENNRSRKDSSLYLQAGAFCSYYIEADDESIVDAYEWLCKTEKLGDSLIICESGSLGRYYQPFVMVFIENNTMDYSKSIEKRNNRKLSDLIISAGSDVFYSPEKVIKIEQNKWQMYPNG